MKTRNGFVSNSSTTSFCIYGVCIDLDDIREEVRKNFNIKSDDGDVDYDEDYDEYQYDNVIEDMAEKDGLECHSPYHDSTKYIGISWASIKDDETGREFKQRIEDTVKKFTDVECTTYEEAWYDG